MVVLPLPLGHHDSASDQAQSLDSDTSRMPELPVVSLTKISATRSNLPYRQYNPQKAQSLHQNDFLQKGLCQLYLNKRFSEKY